MDNLFKSSEKYLYAPIRETVWILWSLYSAFIDAKLIVDDGNAQEEKISSRIDRYIAKV